MQTLSVSNPQDKCKPLNKNYTYLENMHYLNAPKIMFSFFVLKGYNEFQSLFRLGEYMSYFSKHCTPKKKTGQLHLASEFASASDRKLSS